MCTLGFAGKGYSSSFVRNYQKIANRLQADPHTPIRVVHHLDQICSACPHQTKTATCKQQTFIEKLDRAHETVLGLEENLIVSWSEAKALIKARMDVEKFHLACEGCEWKDYGVCERALKTLLGSS